MSEAQSRNSQPSTLTPIHTAVRSAGIVVPLILEVFPGTQSVVEVGCGSGAWLSMFHRLGIKDIFGLADEAVDPELMQIPREKFERMDFEKGIDIGRRFDLCLCLDVAGRLPAARATSFIKDVVRLSDVVVFSAPIPGQRQADAVNEAWPSYWARPFDEAGYECLDLLRHRLWYDGRLDWRYAQNLLVFVRRHSVAGMDSEQRRGGHQVMDLVHPACFEMVCARLEKASPAFAPVVTELELEVLPRKLILAEVKLADARAERVTLKLAQKAMRASTSWKMSAPLRAIGNLVHRLSRRKNQQP